MDESKRHETKSYEFQKASAVQKLLLIAFRAVIVSREVESTKWSQWR